MSGWLRFVVFWLALFGSAPSFAQSFVQPEEPAFVFKEAPAPPAHYVTIKGTFLRVHGHPDQTRLLMRLARHGSTAVMRLATDLDLPIGDTIHITVAEDDAAFWEMQPGRAPRWADGTAYPGLGAIYLRSPSERGGGASPLEQVLEHELVHILLGRAFYPRTVPDWLQEGLAQVKSGEYGPRTTERMARGMLAGGLLELEAITRSFPADPLRADLAYAQSADLISWMGSEYGPDCHRVLIRELSKGEDVRAAVRRATGQSLERVDKAWRSRLESGVPLSASALFDENIFWAAGALLLLVGGILRRRQFKRRLKEMEEEEAELDAMLAVLMTERPRPVAHD